MRMELQAPACSQKCRVCYSAILVSAWLALLLLCMFLRVLAYTVSYGFRVYRIYRAYRFIGL